MRKLIPLLAIVVGAAAFAPQPVAAAECTRQYMQCLNDSYDLEGLYQVLADLECGARYAGCLAASVIAA